MAEMHVYDHGGTVTLLPALPDKWETRSVRELCVEGGVTLDMVWKRDLGVLRAFSRRQAPPHVLRQQKHTAIVGMLMGEGKLALTDRIADYFQDYLPPVLDERLLRLTIGDMLCMATCYRATA